MILIVYYFFLIKLLKTIFMNTILIGIMNLMKNLITIWKVLVIRQ